MNPDDLKQTWRAQASHTRLSIDADGLLEEVLRKQRHFDAILFWRDVREVGVALLMIPVWIYLGVRSNQPWTWYLTVPAIVWIAGFMIVDRHYQKRRDPELGEPLRQRVEGSLAQVEHQIWLLRNVAWWYLLPLTIAMLAYIGHVTWRERSGGWWTGLSFVVVVSPILAVMAAVYWVNQRAVASLLEPRRRELADQLAGLKDETPASSSPPND
jgi:hypothetical protein